MVQRSHGSKPTSSEDQNQIVNHKLQAVQALLMRDQVFTRLLQLARQPNAFFLRSNQIEITILVLDVAKQVSLLLSR
ncbi:unnamed protein product [Caenorhabditis brenneri]